VLPRIAAAQSVSANQATSSGLASLKTADVDVAGNKIFYRRYGQGPPILLVHGFPRKPDVAITRREARSGSHRGMRRSARLRTKLDTRFYRRPRSLFKTHNQELLEAMSKLGFSTFTVIGHDRGGRVAYLDQWLSESFAHDRGPRSRWSYPVLLRRWKR
jgi:haloacetate dehalogenase